MTDDRRQTNDGPRAVPTQSQWPSVVRPLSSVVCLHYISGMLDQTAIPAFHPGRNVRLDTLVRLRWLAVIGQTTAVLVVYLGLDFDLPIWACLAVIALAAWPNVARRVRFPNRPRVAPDPAAWLLAFDIAQLTILLFLTGGIENPFSFLLLGP